MKIVLNGKKQEVSGELSIMQLLLDSGIPHNTVVVELNGDIIVQTHWETIKLKENDKVEIFRFVGGG